MMGHNKQLLLMERSIITVFLYMTHILRRISPTVDLTSKSTVITIISEAMYIKKKHQIDSKYTQETITLNHMFQLSGPEKSHHSYYECSFL